MVDNIIFRGNLEKWNKMLSNNVSQHKTDFPADTQLQWSQGVRLPYWTKYLKFTKNIQKSQLIGCYKNGESSIIVKATFCCV